MKKIENRVHFVREESLIAKSPRGMKGDFEEEEEEEEEEECNFRYQPRDFSLESWNDFNKISFSEFSAASFSDIDYDSAAEDDPSIALFQVENLTDVPTPLHLSRSASGLNPATMDCSELKVFLQMARAKSRRKLTLASHNRKLRRGNGTRFKRTTSTVVECVNDNNKEKELSTIPTKNTRTKKKSLESPQPV